MSQWERDLTFREAFHLSCVPCYQEVARAVGVEKMITFLKTLSYGSISVDEATIDIFWLQGKSSINQMQQIDFLKRFYLSELSISKRTEDIMKKLMIIEEKDGYKLSGKTGWSIQNDINNGWFVGYIEKESNTYFFATNVEPLETFNMDNFPSIRKEVTYSALEQMKIID